MKFTSYVALGLALSAASSGFAQVVAPEFADSYSLHELVTAPGVTPNYGGLMIRITEPNTLYLLGGANSVIGQLHKVSVTREGGHISEWGCSPTEFVTNAPNNDGGLCMGPQGQYCYTTYPSNLLVQTLVGATNPTKTIALTAWNVWASTGAVLFTPPGFPGAGRMKIISYNGSIWYDFTVADAGDGTFDIATAGPAVQIVGQPEGAIYVHAGNPHFTADSVLVSEYGTGIVAAYTIDSNGDPIPSSRRIFISGLSGCEGAEVDPLTGDFFFSTFGGGNRVVRVSGFTKSQSCIGDLNNDAMVDGADLGTLLGQWGDCPQCAADLNGDCIVEGADLGILLGAWGPCQ